MIIIPAIDIRNGNCVRLLQGDPDKETIYSSEPVKQALIFQDAGASLIHVVDLDGAFSGKTVNHDIIKQIASTVEVPIEVGGGIRDGDAIEEYVSSGINRIIIGTALLSGGLDDIISEYKKYIVAGVDARDSKVATHGWKETSEMKAMDIISELHAKGIDKVIYTDISTDGMLVGPNVDAMKKILDTVKGTSLVASGGISSFNDIVTLSALSSRGLMGCIVGKAIYDGRIDLCDSIQKLKQNF